MRLLLFDIDGTLLHVGGSGRTALVRAVQHVTGHTASLDNTSFAGRTDPNILRDVLAANDLPTTEDVLSDVIDAYVDAAEETIHSANVKPLPGAAALLSQLANRPDIVLGLVTGNVEPVAFHKLRAAGFANHFSTGGFGSDYADRSNLPGLAVRRAAEHTGRALSVQDAVVIGDTEHDIMCARQAGTRSVAVCTGNSDSSDLSPYDPDLLLTDLDAPTEVVEQLLAV